MSDAALRKIPLSLLDDPRAPLRQSVEQGALEELMHSMSRRGLLQPIGAMERDGRYEVVWGHRRTMAARELGWPAILCRVVRRDEGGLTLDRAHENLMRADLSPVEEAQLCSVLLQDAGGDIEKTARQVGRSVGWVDARIDLLSWPKEILEAVDAGQLSRAAAKPLTAVTDEAERAWLLKNAVEFGVSERVTRAWLHNWQLSGHIPDPSLVAPAAGSPINPHSLPTGKCFYCEQVDSIGRMPFVQLHETCAAIIASHRPEPVEAKEA